jgi:hypothetical protein
VLTGFLHEGGSMEECMTTLTTAALGLAEWCGPDAVRAFRYELETQIGRLPMGKADNLRCRLEAAKLLTNPLAGAVRDVLAARAAQDDKDRLAMAGSGSSSSSSSSSSSGAAP